MLISAFYGTFFMGFIQKKHDIWDRGGFMEREIFLLKQNTDSISSGFRNNENIDNRTYIRYNLSIATLGKC